MGAAGEVFCGIGLELKQRFPGLPVWTLGYSNTHRYVISRDTHVESAGLMDPNFIYCFTPDPCPTGLKPAAVDIVLDRAEELVWAVQAT